jgi:hypothetical protein
MKRLIAAGTIVSVFAVPAAEAACWRATGDADRCGDVRGFAESLGQVVLTGTSSTNASFSGTNANSGVEYRGAVWSADSYDRQDCGKYVLKFPTIGSS